MEIQLHAPVVSSDGAELGKIDRVVFNPATGETDSIVVRKGAILPRDVELPVKGIRVANPTRVEVHMTKAEVEALPDFLEANYIYPPETWVAPYGWPMGGVMWPTGLAGGYPINAPATFPYSSGLPEEAADRLRQEDDAKAVVGEGSEVIAKGGEKVGEVHNVVVDPNSRKPSSLILRRGFLFTEDVEIPGDWIDSMDDRVVALNVDKVTVEQLAEHKKRDH